MEEYLITNATQVGPTLRGIRQELGLTQAQVGQKLGLPQKEISKMERGAERTSVERLFLLLSALQVELVLRPRGDADAEDGW